MTDRTCAVEGCIKKHKAKGLCNAHYERRRLGLSLDLPPLIRQWETGERLCKHPGCETPRACSGTYCQKHYMRPRKRLNRYGVTHEQFNAMFAGQDNRCAVCRTSETKGIGWCVDHDHVTQNVRGILCDACNKGIGFLQDDPMILAAALRYLTRESA